MKFADFIRSIGLHRSEADHCVYTKVEKGVHIILSLYVDDMVIVGNCKREINKVKSMLSSQFEMKVLGTISHILGMTVRRIGVRRNCGLGRNNILKRC